MAEMTHDLYQTSADFTAICQGLRTINAANTALTLKHDVVFEVAVATCGPRTRAVNSVHTDRRPFGEFITLL